MFHYCLHTAKLILRENVLNMRFIGLFYFAFSLVERNKGPTKREGRDRKEAWRARLARSLSIILFISMLYDKHNIFSLT